MAQNDRFYDYIRNNGISHISPSEDVIFMAPSYGDTGGQMSLSYEDLFSQTSLDRMYPELTDMSGGTRLVLGGSDTYASYSDYIMSWTGYNAQQWGSLARFDGDGTVDFANNTGGSNVTPGSVKDVQELKRVKLQVANTLETVTRDIGGTIINQYWTRSSTTTVYKTERDISAYGLLATGQLTVQGNFLAHIDASCDNLNTGYYYDTTPSDKPIWVDMASNTTANAVTVRAKSFVLENNFNALLTASAQGYIVRVKKAATIQNNAQGAYGIWADENVTFKGLWDNSGVITAHAGDVTIGNYFDEMEKDDSGKVTGAKTVNMSNNSFKAFGIKGGGDITFGDIGKYVKDKNGVYTWISGGSITTGLGDILFDANAIAVNSAEDETVVSFQNNLFESVAISGKNLNANGYFTADLTASVGSIGLEATRYNSSKKFTVNFGNNKVNLYGILLSGNLTALHNFGGSITLDFISTNVYENLNTVNVAGIDATNITVSGSLFTEINVTVDNIANWTTDGKALVASRVYGIKTDFLTADMMDANITVSAGSSYVDPVGLYVYRGMSSGADNDGVIDITGNITSTGGDYSFCIAGGFDGFNFRVSGSLIASGASYNNYAIIAGHFTTGYTQSNQNDRVEIAAGGYVRGDIELGNGENVLVVDSNARIVGNVSSLTGVLSLEYILNANPMDGVTVPGGAGDAIIRGSNAGTGSTFNVTMNMNNSAVGEYVVYQSTSGGLGDWATRSVNFKYQGFNKLIFDSGDYSIITGDQSKIELTARGLSGAVAIGQTCKIVDNSTGTVIFEVEYLARGGNQAVFVVNTLPSTPEKPLGEVTDLGMEYDREKKNVKLSWKDPDNSTQEVFEIEYRVVTDGTIKSNTVIRSVKGNLGEVTIGNIEHNQTIEWRVRQNLGMGDIVSDWTEFTGSAADVTDKAVLGMVEEVTFVAGKSGKNAVGELTWTPGESSEGIAYYIVRYFQSSNYIDKDSINWGDSSLIYVEKKVSNNMLLVGNLNNMEYFYWSVEAVDNKGNHSGFANGETFKVYTDDTTPPVLDLTKPQESVTWDLAQPEGAQMDVGLIWKPATDDRSGVARYTLRFRKSGSSDEWTEILISSTDADFIDPSTGNYVFRLSEYIKDKKSSLTLLENVDYDWQLWVADYVGNEILTPQTGTWKADGTAPGFPKAPDETIEWGVTPLPGVGPSMDPGLTWEPAVDAGIGVSYYVLRFRQEGSEGAWVEIKINKDDPNFFKNGKYQFRLSDYIKNVDPSMTLLENVNYQWELAAVDRLGNKTTPPITGKWEADTENPILGTSITKTETWHNNVEQTVSFSVTWRPGQDDQSIWGYRFEYRKAGTDTWIVVNKQGTSGSALTWSGVLGNADYEYRVSVFDRAGNQSEYVEGTLRGDLNGPAFSSQTATVTSSYNPASKEGSYTFSWSTAQDISVDGRPVSGLKEYVVGYYDANDIYIVIDTIAVGTTSFTIESLNIGSGVYDWSVRAYDWAGNYAEVMGQQSIVLDTTPPTGNFIYFEQDEFGRAIAETITSTNTTQWDSLGANANPVNTEEVSSLVITSYTDVALTLSFMHSFTDDLSDVVFVVQVSNSKQFNTSKTYSFAVNESKAVDGMPGYYESTLRLDDTNGYGIGAIIGMGTGKFVWRVQAYDTSGNSTGLWSETQDGGFVFIADDNTWHSVGSDDIDPTRVTYLYGTNVTTANGRTTLTWSSSYDAFGVKEYEIRYKLNNGSWVTKTIAGDKTSMNMAFNTATQQGTYTWNVRAVDYANNKSDWSSNSTFYVDVTKPTFNLTGVSASVGANDVYITWTAAKDNISVAGYEIQVRNKLTGAVQTYRAAGNATSYVLNNLDPDISTVYEYRIRAYDQVNNYSHTWSSTWNPSETKTFTVGKDPGDTMATAESLSWGVSRSDSVGGSDLKDFYQISVTQPVLINLKVSGVSPVIGKSGVKVTVYSVIGGKQKKIGTYSVKNGTLSLPVITADTGTYYFEVVSGSKNDVANYTIEANKTELPGITPNNAFASAVTIKLTTSGSSQVGQGGFDDGWVGFKDAADYYVVKGDAAGIVSISVKGVDANIKITLYSADQKKLKTISLKPGDHTNLFAGTLVTKDFYIVVETPDKGQGKYITDYDLEVKNSYFQAATSNNDVNSATSVSMMVTGNTGTGKVTGGWVGYGDAADYYVINAERAAQMSISVSGAEASLKVSLWAYNDKGKLVKLKQASISKPGDYSNLLTGVLVNKGNVYLVVESGDKGKGKQNSNYDVSIKTDYFPAATNDNSFGAANQYDWNSIAGTKFSIKDDWVGFGDASNYYKFEGTMAGTYSISLKNLDAGISYKVTLYDATNGNKKLKTWTVKGADKLLFDAQLLKGDFYISVESGDKGKGKQNGYYDLEVVQNHEFPAATANNSLAAATKLNWSNVPSGMYNVSGWVGYGDATDCYKFEGTAAGTYSIMLRGLDASTTYKVSLYDANQKKIKSWTVSKNSQFVLYGVNDPAIMKGDFYISVDSGDNGKGKQNGDYEIAVIRQEAFPKANGDTNLGTLGATKLTANDWVGYGDAEDNFFFELTSASRVDIDLGGLDGNARLGKELKLTLYDANNKKVALDADFLSKNELLAGRYRVSVQISNQDKYYSGYQLSIAQA